MRPRCWARTDFDPQSDSTIRVQAGLLRLKLAEYYSSKDAEDPIVVEGTYIPLFHPRAPVGARAHAAPSSAAASASIPREVRRAWVVSIAVLSILLATAVTIIGVMVTGRKAGATAHAETYPPVPVPSENLTLTEIPSTREFVFQRETSAPRKGDLTIINEHPQAGEATAFLASPSSPLTEDYALIGIVPGLTPEHSVLILARTTTFGTQAAAEYVWRENSVADLLTRLTGSKTGELKPFEAVVHVKIARGVPVEAELVALHKR